MGVLQEGAIPTSSLLMNVVDAMSKEFKVIFELNKKFTDNVIYKSITGADDFEQDYYNDIQISPTANAQFSNQMQRIQLATAELDTIDLVLSAGGNPMPIVKSYYEALGSNNIDKIFPENMTPEEQKQREQMMQMQKQQQEMEQLQTELLNDAKIQEIAAKVQNMQQESQRKDAETSGKLQLMEAQAMLAFEQAQTEDEKNKQQEKLKAVQILIDMDNEDQRRIENKNQ